MSTLSDDGVSPCPGEDIKFAKFKGECFSTLLDLVCLVCIEYQLTTVLPVSVYLWMEAKLSHSPFRAQELTLMGFPRPGLVLFTFLPSTGGQLDGS